LMQVICGYYFPLRIVFRYALYSNDKRFFAVIPECRRQTLWQIFEILKN